MKPIHNWRDGFKFYTTWAHLIGLLFSGVSAGLALWYGAMDSVQHSLLSPTVTYIVFFLIILGALIGRFIKQ